MHLADDPGDRRVFTDRHLVEGGDHPTEAVRVESVKALVGTLLQKSMPAVDPIAESIRDIELSARVFE